MEPRIIVIDSNVRQSAKDKPDPLECYTDLPNGFTAGLTLTLVHAAAVTQEMYGNILGIVIRIETKIEHLNPKLFKADKETIDWENLRERIIKSREKFPGKVIVVDCGRWIDEVINYIKANNSDNFFSGIRLQNEAFGIKRSLLRGTSEYQNTLPKEEKIKE